MNARRTTNRPTKHPRTLFVVGLILCALGFGYWQVSTTLQAYAQARQVEIVNRESNYSRAVGKIISADPSVSYSVATLNLRSGNLMTSGTTGAVDGASVSKLISANLYLHQVETGQISLSTKINDVGAPRQLERLVRQSDDNVWESINSRIGHPALEVYAKQLGLNSYDADNNFVSSADVARYLGKLYAGELLNRAHTTQLLSYMHDTNFEDLITPAIPKSYQIYHKVGETDDVLNDAAIIAGGQKSFVLVIFTEGHGTYQWTERAKNFQAITSAALTNL